MSERPSDVQSDRSERTAGEDNDRDRSSTAWSRRRLLQATGAVATAGLTSQIVSAQSVAEGPTVYVGSHDETLYAVDTETGEQQWIFDQPSGPIESSPTVVNGVIFFGSNEGNIYAVDAETGDKQWRFEAGGSVKSSPTVLNGTVYFGGGSDVYALDSETGSEQWRFDTNEGIESSPSVADGTLFVGSGVGIIGASGALHALDAESGDEEWTFTTPYEVRSSPTAVDGTVYLGSDQMYALDVETGREQWRFENSSGIRSALTVADDTVFFGDGMGETVYAVDTQTGEQEWIFETDGWVISSPTVAGESIYIGSTDGNVYALDQATGSQQWRFKTNSETIGSSPTVVDGTVFIGSRTRQSSGKIHALDAETGDEQWHFGTGDEVMSSPTVVADPNNGDSIDSRVRLGTLGHHHTWAGESSPDDTHDTVPESFSEVVDAKRSMASDIDDLAAYLSETEDVEALLETYQDAVVAEELDDELATDAVRRLVFGENVSERLLRVTTVTDGVGNQQQIGVTTTEFVVKLGVSIAFLQVSLTELADDSRFADLIPDGEFAESQLDSALEDLVSLGVSQAMQSEALSAINDVVDDLYSDSMTEEYGSADQFVAIVEDRVSATVANLTIQRRIETGDEFLPMGVRLPVGVDRFANVEAGLSYLNSQLSPETVENEGLAGTDEGMQEASLDAISQLDRVASTAETFLDELDGRLEFISILETVYELITGVQRGEALWRIAGLIGAILFQAGKSVATVRAIGTFVGEFTIQLLMTIHARGMIGVRRGDPLTLDDLDEMVPDIDTVLEEVTDIDDRWDVGFVPGVKGV